MVELADQLSVQPRSGGERLAEAVTAELSALAMPDAQLMVDVRRRDELTAHGRDSVQLLLQPHPGGEPRPLGRGASGGELSRIMLAIEVVLAATDPVPTFVFDEVDSGIGGASAIEVGRRLARLAESSQVIAVTHLAQVAAFATNHLRVEKALGRGDHLQRPAARGRRPGRRDGPPAVRPARFGDRPRPRPGAARPRRLLTPPPPDPSAFSYVPAQCARNSVGIRRVSCT